MDTLRYGVPLAIAFVSMAGLGRHAAGCGPPQCATRAFFRGALIGFFAFGTLFGLLAQLGAGFPVAGGLMGLLVLVGLCSAAADLRSRPRTRLLYAGLASAGVLLSLLMQVMPVQADAADPGQYAFAATTLFRGEWLVQHVPVGAGLARMSALLHEAETTRAPSLAVPWAPAALGAPLTPNAITAVCAGYLAVAVLLFVDLLGPGLDPVGRAVLGLGALGPLNAVAVLSAGQLAQTFALMVALATIWLCRAQVSAGVRAGVLVAAGYLVSAGYPEFLLAFPLYWGCLVLICRSTFRQAAADGLCILAGFIVVQAATRLDNIRFLVAQQGSPTTFWPLAHTPGTVLDVWTIVIANGDLPRRLVALLTIPIAVYVWHRFVRRGTPTARPFAMMWVLIAGLVPFAVVWTWVALQAANPNYVTFKVACWLSFGLMLGVWLLLGQTTVWLRGVGATVVLVLAATRAFLLVSDVSERVPAYVAGPSAAGPAVEIASGAECLVHAPTSDQWVVARTIAVSAAPARNCTVLE